MAAVSGSPSAAQPGSAALSRRTGPPCGSPSSCHRPAAAPPLQPPPGARRSCCSWAIAAAGNRGCDPSPLGLGSGPSRPGCSQPLLCSHGRDHFLQFSRRALRSRSSPSSSRRALPGSPLRVRRRPQAFLPAGPTSCASLSAAPGLGAGQSARSGYKVSAPVAAQGIKEGAGSRTSETRGRGWVLPKRATPVTFPL